MNAGGQPGEARSRISDSSIEKLGAVRCGNASADCPALASQEATRLECVVVCQLARKNLAEDDAKREDVGRQVKLVAQQDFR